MLKVGEILGSAHSRAGLVVAAAAVLLLAACGQKGNLYLQSGEAAAGRLSLPQTLNPVPPASAPTETGTGAANPAPRP